MGNLKNITDAVMSEVLSLYCVYSSDFYAIPMWILAKLYILSMVLMYDNIVI